MTDETHPEKRQSPRRQADYIALLRVSDLLQGRGHIKNISRDGLLLQTFNLFRHIRTDKIGSRVGAPIKVVFSAQTLTAYGRIVRINSRQGEVAVALKEISDQQIWEKMCAG